MLPESLVPRQSFILLVVEVLTLHSKAKRKTAYKPIPAQSQQEYQKETSPSSLFKKCLNEVKKGDQRLKLEGT